MKIKKFILVLILLFVGTFIYQCRQKAIAQNQKVCVFQTVFGEQVIDTNLIYPPSGKVKQSLKKSLEWLAEMQLSDGGWSAASTANKNNSIKSDPATTAMTAMAFLRHGSTIDKKKYESILRKATSYILKAIANTPPDGSNIAKGSQTQIQRKLGSNIDLILATQFLSNLLQTLEEDHSLYSQIYNDLNKCVDIMQQMQATNGSFKNPGWAGVLQSALANNAMEVALNKGAWVDESGLNKSREYQKSNYNPITGNISTSDGAGVMLYAIAGTVRASAKEAHLAIKTIEKGIEEARLEADSKVTVNNLLICGLDDHQAFKLHTAYCIFQSAKNKIQEEKVMKGFGNNGGEEFLSHLQNGESLIVANDQNWKNWFDNIAAQLMHAQNSNGYWQGHHCITSPVFCTATCVLILSINNDVEALASLGY